MEFKDHNINYWFFTELSGNDFEQDNAIIELKSGRNINVKENDKVVFLTHSNKGLVFSLQARIGSIEKEKLSNFSFYTIAFENVEKIKNKNYLENYIYSLTRIKDFENPIKHFNFPYGRLKTVEYDAIINGEIFMARTKFGRYINSLPKEHKIAFIEYFIEVNADLYFNDYKNFDEALKILEEYIESHITQPARYMKMGYSFLSNLISNEEIKSIGFSKRELQIDYFETQNQYITKFLGLIDSNDNAKEHLTDYVLIKSQLEFGRLFRRTPWPIIMN